MYGALFVVAFIAAQADDREAEMFGGGDDDAPSADARDDAIFGGGDDDTMKPGFVTAVTPGLLDSQNDPLAIGGQLFLRLNSQFREGTALGDGALNGASLFDVFADARPSDRVRAYGQLRMNFDYTVLPGEKNFLGQELEPFSLQLAQAWLKFDLGQVAFVTAGRQRIRWGTGRFWNPTDFINQEIRNSIDFFDQRVGVDLIKVHFPMEALGWNLYLIGTIGGIDVLNDTGLAARAEFVFGPAELALSSFVKQDAPLRFGADISAGIWLFDVKAEGVLTKGLGRRLFEGELDFENGVIPTEIDTDDNWYFEGVVGIETQIKYSDTDTFSIGAEYFWNPQGYAKADIYPFLFLQGAYVPLYTGQHYVGIYGLLPAPGDWNDVTFIMSTIGNVSDLSFMTRFDIQYTLLQYVTVNAFVAAHYGSVGEFKLGLDIPAIPGIPQLQDGLKLENEFLDVGFALRVAL